MATFALRPAFPMRTGSSGSRRDHRKQRVRDTLHSKAWRTVAITVGAIALTLFSVLAPMIGDPAGRLFALDTTPTVPAGGDVWTWAFEFTPALLGPAITADMLTLAEEDFSVVTMPELEIHALPPPVEDSALSPPG